MNTLIKQLAPDLAEKAFLEILETLPEYFGLPEANAIYAKGLKEKNCFGYEKDGKIVGLLALEFPYPNNANIYWMGVTKSHHRQNIGSSLVSFAAAYAQSRGAETITVETVSPSEKNEDYLKTYCFYEAQGFQPLFDLKPNGFKWNMVYMMKFFT